MRRSQWSLWKTTDQIFKYSLFIRVRNHSIVQCTSERRINERFFHSIDWLIRRNYKPLTVSPHRRNCEKFSMQVNASIFRPMKKLYQMCMQKWIEIHLYTGWNGIDFETKIEIKNKMIENLRQRMKISALINQSHWNVCFIESGDSIISMNFAITQFFYPKSFSFLFSVLALWFGFAVQMEFETWPK